MNFFEDKTEDKPLEPDNDELVTAEAQEPVDDGSGYVITSKSSNRNTYILLAVCVLAIAGVWLAGLAHKKPAETKDSKKTDTNQLDIALARLLGVKNSADSETLVNAFYELPDGKQVKLNELTKNPFVLQEKLKADTDADADISRVKKADLEKKLTGEIGGLHLNSIMKGPGGHYCMINGTIYKEGDMVTESFRIKTIEVNRIILEADDYVCQLEL